MKYLIVLFLLWSAVSDFFASRLSVLGYIDEIIVLFLFIHLLLHAMVKASQKSSTDIRITITALLISLLLCWSFGSFLVNLTSLPQLLLFLFSISKGVIIFYWLKTFLKDAGLVQTILQLIKWLILVQLPFFAAGLLLSGTDYIGDHAVGAFITGDASAVGTLFWLGIIISVARFEIPNQRFYLYAAMGLLLLLIVTSTKQLTVLLPVVFVYLYGKRLKVINIKKALFFGGGFVVALFLYNAVERKWMQNFNVDASEVNLLDYMNESEKILGYYSLLYELPDEVKHPLVWGAGPGMYGSYAAMNSRTPLAQKYIMYYFDRIPDGLGGTLAYRSSSVIGFWGDIGLVGLFLIFAVYLYHTFHYAKQMRLSSQPVLYNLIIATGFLLVAQSFILNVFEGNSFSLNLFWILCGIAAATTYTIPQNKEADA